MALYQGQLMQGMGEELGMTPVKLSGVCGETEELRKTIMAKFSQLTENLVNMYYPHPFENVEYERHYST